jgi:hypothetical protein
MTYLTVLPQCYMWCVASSHLGRWLQPAGQHQRCYDVCWDGNPNVPHTSPPRTATPTLEASVVAVLYTCNLTTLTTL